VGQQAVAQVTYGREFQPSDRLDSVAHGVGKVFPERLLLTFRMRRSQFKIVVLQVRLAVW
jgi:hypothetical protein